MKTGLKLATTLAFGVIIGLVSNNFAMSNTPSVYKVAVVDVQKVVSGSKQVQALKEEQKKKTDDLVKFINNARADVGKETDASKKKAMEDKYNKEFASKKAAVEKEYAARLKQIDNDISAVITNTAKAENYDLVLAKGIVLYGGNDITATVSKSVK